MRKVTVLEVSGLKLKGAYGRQTNMEDWQSGKDFKIVGGPYCSIKDLPDMAKEFDVLEFVLLNGDELYTEIISEDLLHLMNGEGA